MTGKDGRKGGRVKKNSVGVKKRMTGKEGWKKGWQKGGRVKKTPSTKAVVTKSERTYQGIVSIVTLSRVSRDRANDALSVCQ